MQFKDFTGLRNDVEPERFTEKDLYVANNINLDNTGKLLTRNGFIKRINGDFHSLWSNGKYCFFVVGAELHRLHENFTTTEIVRTDLTLDYYMSFSVANDVVYYSNGKETGIYQIGRNRTWGIQPPVFQPIVEATSGSMQEGRYQYALTYIRYDGQESGTGVADSIVLTDDQAINFTDIPVSPDTEVTHKVIYITPRNGETLYRAMLISNNVTSAYYNNPESVDLRHLLTTQFMTSAPAGQIVANLSGVFYVAYDNFIFYSDEFGYELFDLRRFLPFEETITMLAPVQDGIWVGTVNKIYFINGLKPKDARLLEKSDYGVLPTSVSYIVTSKVQGLENYNVEEAPIFITTDGLSIGLSGGILVNLTEATFDLNASGQASTIYRQEDGIDQVIISISN